MVAEDGGGGGRVVEVHVIAGCGGHIGLAAARGRLPCVVRVKRVL